jgi:2-polyprenyl-6-hydroxyphenyl methylase/3-demethylubiquinone-9 3-methyltransferase
MTAIVGSGFVVDLFEIMERYAPSPVVPPTALLWGREEHVRELFGDRVESLELRHRRFVLGRFEDPVEFRDYFKANHPLAVALYRDLAAEPARVAALDRDLVEAATRAMRGGVDGRQACDAEALVIVARKRG